MSAKHKLLTAGTVATLAAAAFTAAYTRKSKTDPVAQHWLRLLSGAQLKQTIGSGAAALRAGKNGRSGPAEIIGSGDYPLYPY